MASTNFSTAFSRVTLTEIDFPKTEGLEALEGRGASLFQNRLWLGRIAVDESEQ
uniref:hypothetical protein n=1 Tax=Chlorogloea sp. CCALA 695 TaxID=2107693 RepID=UPI001304C4EA|nr:hypothetical protein [Chlorogloea sp. CCALA 695]